MDVPFISSGAMNRTHYSVVSQVENASTPQAADRILLRELDTLRLRLSDPTLDIKGCKECLVMILYCLMSLASSPPRNVDFALPHAVSLAEAGKTVEDKRIGYLFCAEVMHSEHDLQLMLVNTLRKDLESPLISRISLALDALIQSSTQDVLPAVQARLYDLLSHDSPHVRRRALLACGALSIHDAELLGSMQGKILKRLKDSDSTVVDAALAIIPKFEDKRSARVALDELLRATWLSTKHRSKRRSLLKILRSLFLVKPSEESALPLIQIVKYAADLPAFELLREAFLVLSSVSPQAILSNQKKSRIILADCVRHLLTSSDPNEQYLFICCLECLECSLWAGTLPEIPPVLDEGEVERIMKLLDSPDSFVRKKTLKLLCKVDPGIVESYYGRSLDSVPAILPIKAKNELVTRLLEVVDILLAQDAELYARGILKLFMRLEGILEGALEDQPVLEGAVKHIITHIRIENFEWQLNCVTTFVAPVVEPDTRIGPTLMVIICALTCEYAGKISTSHEHLLSGLAGRLSSYATSVQDACLLSMLRLSAECNAIPSDVTSLVKNLSQFSGRHIRRRCDQFLNLSSGKHVRDIVSKAQSSSLPDFVVALTNYQADLTKASQDTTALTPGSSIGPSSPRGSTPSKLRYDAYEAPHATQSLRHVANSRNRETDSTASTSSIDRDRSLSSSRISDVRVLSDELSRTVTAGQLTLAAGDIVLENTEQSEIKKYDEHRDDGASTQASRTDLIALDSPFVFEPMDDGQADSGPDSQTVWDSMENFNVRGWCDAPSDVIMRRLRGLQYLIRVKATGRPPFEDELEVLVRATSTAGEQKYAALRLRKGDEETCLWRLRCSDEGLRAELKRLLADI